jgi:ATP-binding cassette subfamily C (CFTR/MRP) protein 1
MVAIRARLVTGLSGDKIILTSHSVDLDTQAIVQGIIDRHFASRTVLSVMHWLEHVRSSYDKVAVLEAGEVVEFDTPASLLARPSSRFSALCASSDQR